MHLPTLSLVPCTILLSLMTIHSFGQGLSVSSTVSDHNGHAITCHGQADGSIDLTVSGGTSPYSFLWSTSNGTPSADGAVSEDLTGLSAGNYQVVVSDSVGAADTLQLVLTQPAALSISLFSPQYNGHNIHCFGGTDGQINTTVSGGVAPYTYQWSTGDSVPNLGGLAAGAYQLIVIGANGCSDTASITLSQPTELTTSLTSPLTASGFELPCEGSNAGSIDLTVSGGAGTYLYNWSNGGITQDPSGIAAGWYSVQVSDGNGCVRYDSLELREPTPLSYSGSAYEYQPGEFFSCDTCNDGQATPVPAGGTPPYTYLWSNGQTTQTATGLAPQVYYSFTITDAAGCAVADSFALPANQTQTPLELIGTLSSYPGGYQVSYMGAADGWIDLQVIGGSSPYSYSWSTSTGSGQANGATTQDISGLSSGTYTVVVTDNEGEQAERTFTLTAPSNALQVYPSTLHPTCYGQETGFMEALVSGGTPPYTYQWSTTDGSAHANGSTMLRIENLGAGSYTVVVHDANNDSVVVSDTVVVPTEMLTSITPSMDEQGYHLQCGEGSATVLDLQVSGGQPPYTYQWDNGKFTQDIEVEEGGTYMVQVKDSKDCIRYDSLLVNAPDPLQVNADWLTYPNGQLFSCDTCEDAELTLSIAGGVEPITTTLTSVHGSQNGPVFSGIYADTEYSLLIVDGLGCTIDLSGAQAIVVPREGFSSLQVSADLSSYPGGYNVSSFGGMDGWIDLNISGQMSQETVLWSDGNTQRNRSGMSAGYYEVTVSDNAGQSITKSWTLTQPQSGMSVMLNGQYSSCKGIGSVDAMVNGGTPPYSYVWYGPWGEMNDQQWSSISVYDQGLYSVVVNDANGDSALAQLTLEQGEPLSAEVSSPLIYGDYHASCSHNDGSIFIALSGGQPPYQIHIDGWRNHAGLSDSGNDSGFNMDLTTSDTLIVMDSLYAGGYNINVNDMSGCGHTYEYIELQHPDEFGVSVVPNEYPNGYSFSCDTCADGSAMSIALGGQAPYSHMWMQLPDNGGALRLKGASMMGNPEYFIGKDLDSIPPIISTDATLTGIAPETNYLAIVTDGMGCMGMAGFSLERPNDALLPEPAWGLYGTPPLAPPLGGAGPAPEPWLGTSDSTDVVMKANNQVQLRLGANGVTELLQGLRVSGIPEIEPDTVSAPLLRLMVAGPDGSVAFVHPGPHMPWEDPNPCRYAANGSTIPYWDYGVGKIFTACEPVNVGIGTDDPLTRLDVRGQTYSQTISVNTYSQDAKVTIKGSQPGTQNQFKALEVQDSDGVPSLQVFNNGKVGIGLSANHVFGEGVLEVNGTIRSKEVVVEVNNWYDHVFADTFQLRPIDELENYINTNGHLPDIPTTSEAMEEGISLGELNALLLKKVEELTLYVILLQKQNDAIRLEMGELKTANQ